MSDNQRANIEVLTRIISLETKLAATIDKIDRLVDLVERRHNSLAGDETTPSILSRVISLEESRKNVKWFLATIYSAILGIIVTLIERKL